MVGSQSATNKVAQIKKMALKTFNLDNEVYKEFSEHCKKNGISMSKKIENFIRQEIEQIRKPKTKQETYKKIEDHPLSKYC